MNFCYYFDGDGYFRYPGTYDDVLPTDATLTPAPELAGSIAHWDGTAWSLVENHKGEKGYINDIPFTITEDGPYPEGWQTYITPKLCYEYDNDGYYAGFGTMYNNLLPNNSTLVQPTFQDGFIPRWEGSAWAQVEDHKGTKGYVDGEPFEIKEYGPYPAGWSATPLEPTPQEVKQRRFEEIDRQLKEFDSSAGRALLELADPSTPPEDRVYSEAKVAEINQAKKLLRVERTALEATT